MTPNEERAYMEGQKAMLRRQLREILRELGYDSPEANAHGWVLERAEAINILRQVCEDFGDNDWPDDLHLGDAIEKHLWDNLEATRIAERWHEMPKESLIVKVTDTLD